MLCVDFPSTFTLLKDKREIGNGNPPAVTAAGQRPLAFPWCSWMSPLFHVKLMLPLSRVTRTTASTSREDWPGSTSSWMGSDAGLALLMCVCAAPELVQDCESLPWTGWEIKHCIMQSYITETGCITIPQWMRALRQECTSLLSCSLLQRFLLMSVTQLRLDSGSSRCWQCFHNRFNSSESSHLGQFLNFWYF